MSIKNVQIDHTRKSPDHNSCLRAKARIVPSSIRYFKTFVSSVFRLLSYSLSYASSLWCPAVTVKCINPGKWGQTMAGKTTTIHLRELLVVNSKKVLQDLFGGERGSEFAEKLAQTSESYIRTMSCYQALPTLSEWGTYQQVAWNRCG